MSVLLIAPQDRQAWLVGPDHEAARDGVPMCASHADRVTVPFGWQLRDDRPVAKPRARRKSRARTAPPEPAHTVADAVPAPADPAPAQSAEPATPESLDVAPEAAPEEPDADIALDSAETGPAQVEARTDDQDLSVEGADAAADGVAAGESASHAVASRPNRPHSPADVPVLADDVAAALLGSGARLTVVPGDDDPSKTFAVESDGQTALWAESQRDDHEPSDDTPLLKRAFRVVRED